jgi:hypothetical protein
MPLPEGVLHRAIADMTIGVVKSTRARDARDRDMGLTEIMQQFQLEFSGVGGATWGFVTLPVVFDFPFYYAPGQRDPDFDRPHFWFGAEVSPAVAVSATVSGWSKDPDNGAIVAATVSLGVAGPAVAFKGVVHLTFQGFSALAEAEADIQ